VPAGPVRCGWEQRRVHFDRGHWVKENEGMIVYGGFEPEFSVRACSSGAEIVTAPNIKVSNRFKSSPERVKFTSQARTFRYTSTNSTSGSSPIVTENRTFRPL
jgi:hypothetical protein